MTRHSHHLQSYRHYPEHGCHHESLPISRRILRGFADGVTLETGADAP